MILNTALFLLAAGMAAFALGKIFKRPGVAMIGAIIIIGVGATALTGNIQVATGEDTEEWEEYDPNRGQNVIYTNSTTVYTDIETAADFPVGAVLMSLGAVMLIGATGEASEKELKVDK